MICNRLSARGAFADARTDGVEGASRTSKESF